MLNLLVTNWRLQRWTGTLLFEMMRTTHVRLIFIRQWCGCLLLLKPKAEKKEHDLKFIESSEIQFYTHITVHPVVVHMDDFIFQPNFHQLLHGQHLSKIIYSPVLIYIDPSNIYSCKWETRNIYLSAFAWIHYGHFDWHIFLRRIFQR